MNKSGKNSVSLFQQLFSYLETLRLEVVWFPILRRLNLVIKLNNE